MLAVAPMSKSGGKNRGKPKSKPKKKAPKVAPEGDLTTIGRHVEAFLAGESSAGSVLTDMGRDAAFTVLQLAAERADEELEKFGRRLAAIPPQVTTNLHDLRRKSVRDRLQEERKKASPATLAEALAVAGGAVGIFDPQRVLEDLATGGRPRRAADRLQTGDIACFGLSTADSVPVGFSQEPVPDGQPTARLRLRVDSGLVYLGPPEAADGPRMGTVRLDPFSTNLDAYAGQGHFVRMPNGVLGVFGYLDADGAVRLHVRPDDDPEAALNLSPLEPVTLPRWVGSSP